MATKYKYIVENQEIETLDLVSIPNGFEYETIEFENEIQTISKEELLRLNIGFGRKLLDQFLVDNMNMAIAFTTELSVSMMQRFAPIEFLARNGDIKNVKYLISQSTIDAVFTQERKDNYILMCNQYLNI